MATVEEIKLKFTSDTAELKSTKQELVEMGAIAEQDAKAFDKITESANKTNNAVKDIGKEGAVGLDKLGDTADKTGKKLNETAKNGDKLKSGFKTLRQEIRENTNELERLRKKYGENSVQFEQQRAKVGLLTDALQDQRRQISLLNPEDKIRAFQNFGSGVFSAIQVATGSLQAFGASSEELDKAIYRISGAVSALYGLTSFIQLKEQFQDIGVVLRASGAATEIASEGIEAASNAAETFSDTASGVVTGSKEAAAAIYGFDNATKAIKTNVGLATVATNANTAAQVGNAEAGAANTTVLTTQNTVTKSVTASTIAFTRALLASPLGIIAAAIGAVIGGLYLYEKATKASREENERALQIEAALLTARGEQEKAERALAMAQGKASSTAQARADAFQELKDQLQTLYQEGQFTTLQGKVEEIEEKKRTGRFIDRRKNIETLQKTLEWAKEKGNKTLQEDVTKQIELQNKLLQKDEAAVFSLEKLKATEESIKKTYNAKLGLLDKQDADEKKANDERAKSEEEQRLAKLAQQRDEYIQKLLNQLEEEKKIRQDAIDLKRTEGVDDKTLLEDQLKSIELEKESLANISKQANGTRFKGEIQSKINQLTRDELKLRAELGNLNVQQELKRIEQTQRGRENELTLLREIGTKESDIITKRIDGIDVDVESLQLLKDNVSNLKDKADIDAKINDLLFQRQILQVQFNKATEGENQESYQQTIDAIDKQLERTLANNKLIAKSDDDLNEKNLKSEIQAIETKILINKKANKSVTDLEIELAALRKKLNKEDYESVNKTEEEKREQFLQTIDFAKSVYDQFATFSQDLNQQASEEYLATLENQKEQGLISEEEYQQKLKEFKRKEAEDRKADAIFRATLDFFASLVAALTAPPPANITNLAFNTALGGLNLARVIATPIPKFKKGTLSVPGTYVGDDSVLAMLEPDEAIMPREINKKYRPTIQAIYNQTISPKLLNDFVSKKITYDEKNISVSNNINATIDPYTISKIVSKNKSVEVTNADLIGKSIAYYLNENYNPRRK